MISNTQGIEELPALLRWMLNLPTLATAEEVSVELNKAIEKAGASSLQF